MGVNVANKSPSIVDHSPNDTLLFALVLFVVGLLLLDEEDVQQWRDNWDNSNEVNGPPCNADDSNISPPCPGDDDDDEPPLTSDDSRADASRDSAAFTIRSIVSFINAAVDDGVGGGRFALLLTFISFVSTSMHTFPVLLLFDDMILLFEGGGAIGRNCW